MQPSRKQNADKAEDEVCCLFGKPSFVGWGTKLFPAFFSLYPKWVQTTMKKKSSSLTAIISYQEHPQYIAKVFSGKGLIWSCLKIMRKTVFPSINITGCCIAAAIILTSAKWILVGIFNTLENISCSMAQTYSLLRSRTPFQKKGISEYLRRALGQLLVLR